MAVPLGKLVFPQKVKVRLLRASQEPFRQSNVLIGVHLHARTKNDFFLQPFGTNSDGEVTITLQELKAESAAHYDSGLMDYAEVEDAKPLVQIRALTEDEIEKALVSRTQVWRSLLKGETQRWSSIEELVALYRNAANANVSVIPADVLWNADCEVDECSLLTAERRSLGG